MIARHPADGMRGYGGPPDSIQIGSEYALLAGAAVMAWRPDGARQGSRGAHPTRYVRCRQGAVVADQWAKHLGDRGYTGIALPSPEFGLFTLVYERNGARGQQNAFEQLAPGVAARLPAAEQNANLPPIAGERTRAVDLGVGLKVLSGLVAALGGGTAGLDAGFGAARKLTFAYDGLSSESLNAVALQQALNGVPAPAGGVLRDWLDDHLYVITSVFRAKTISVTGHSESGAKVAIDVPAISNAVGDRLAVATGGGDDATVTFSGAAGVPFGARLFQILKIGSGASARLTLRTAKEATVTIKAMPALESVAGGGAAQWGPRPAVLDWAPESEAQAEAAAAAGSR